jgi:hypothetical protein
MPASCVWAHTLVGAGLVVRGGDLSCEAETGSSSGKLVGDAANRLKTGRLASEGLANRQPTTTQAEHKVNGGLPLDVVVGKGTTILKLLASKQETTLRVMVLLS